MIVRTCVRGREEGSEVQKEQRTCPSIEGSIIPSENPVEQPSNGVSDNKEDPGENPDRPMI